MKEKLYQRLDYELASPWQRLLAFCSELSLGLMMLFLFAKAFLPNEIFSLILESNSHLLNVEQQETMTSLYQMAAQLALLFLIVDLGLLAWRGQTIGLLLFKIRIVDCNGERASFWKILLIRQFLYHLLLAIVVVAFYGLVFLIGFFISLTLSDVVISWISDSTLFFILLFLIPKCIPLYGFWTSKSDQLAGMAVIKC